MLIRAELIKLTKNKLTYFGIILSLVPFIITLLFASGSKSFLLFGKYDLLSYTNGMFSTVALGIGIFSIYFSMIINSVISSEINSDMIIYEIIGKSKRKKIFISKIISLLIFFSIILCLMLIFIILGYEFFLRNTEYAISTHDKYELGTFIYAIIYYYGLIIFISSLSFLGLGNSLVIGSFIENLLIVKLSSIVWLAPYIIGSPMDTNADTYSHNFTQFMSTQYVLLFFAVIVCLFICKHIFESRDF
ncbi:MAG: hypothetical protein LBC17_00005 [Lactobacillaceae bacterium]|jgi:hypothetical protein|nr:hypothetical protein [Lactobacillaceae bacterium]